MFSVQFVGFTDDDSSLNRHIWTKWRQFFRQHFRVHLWEEIFVLLYISLKLILWSRVSIARCNGLVPDSHKAWPRPLMNVPWWRHQMEPFFALLALCVGNSPVPVNSPHKGQWCGALIFSLICVWINGWVNNRDAGDFRRHRAHYDVTVMAFRILNDVICSTSVTSKLLITKATSQQTCISLLSALCLLMAQRHEVPVHLQAQWWPIFKAIVMPAELE